MTLLEQWSFWIHVSTNCTCFWDGVLLVLLQLLSCAQAAPHDAQSRLWGSNRKLSLQQGYAQFAHCHVLLPGVISPRADLGTAWSARTRISEQSVPRGRPLLNLPALPLPPPAPWGLLSFQHMGPLPEVQPLKHLLKEVESAASLPLTKACRSFVSSSWSKALKKSVFWLSVWENQCVPMCAPCWLSHWVRQPSAAPSRTEGWWEGGLWLHQSPSVCSSQECWEIICSIVPLGIFSCALSSLAVSNSSDRHPVLPWEAKNSLTITTVGKSMRFQGNEGNLLENSSDVRGPRGPLDVTLTGLWV